MFFLKRRERRRFKKHPPRRGAETLAAKRLSGFHLPAPQRQMKK
jgi:hypothetical protein